MPTHASIPPVVPSFHNIIGMHVSHNIRQNIIEGQYIDLVSLLPPSPGGEEKKLMINNLGEIISRDANLKKVDTLIAKNFSLGFSPGFQFHYWDPRIHLE